MSLNEDFGPCLDMDIVRVSGDGMTGALDQIAAEIPLTIEANGVEIATLLASPSHLEELVRGYLFTSGFINAAGEMKNFSCDRSRWLASVEVAQTPDPALLQKRLYTSGSGKCAMYTTVTELSMRRKLQNSLTVTRGQVVRLARLLKEGTPLFQKTGAVHTAILCDTVADRLITMDDVARHNAVDKVIGSALAEGVDLSRCICARTGRTSSEIMYKTRRSGIAVTLARGAPTHQAMYLAREMGITLIGFARENSFTIYSCAERILLDGRVADHDGSTAC
jgi:FdhD protein